MGILDVLRRAKTTPAESSLGDTDTVRKVVAELDAVAPERARHLAALGYLLGRVANADMDICSDEIAEMEAILERQGQLPPDQAALVVRIVSVQNELFGRTEDYLVTREFREITTREERLAVLDCLFAVAAADSVITADEEAVIRQITSELGLAHPEFVAARSAYSKYRSVMKE
jgi:uncharacterized tellurite resistance protein B-like protein